jgi:hypothetical protein
MPETGFTAGDWIAVAAILAGALVAIVVAILAALSGRRDRRHQIALAREERGQHRLHDAYRALLPTLLDYRVVVSQVEPPIVLADPFTPPVMPEGPETRRRFAGAQLDGSRQVGAMLDSLQTAFGALSLTISLFQDAQARLRSGGHPEAGREMAGLGTKVQADKAAALALIDQIHDRMREELGQEPRRIRP